MITIGKITEAMAAYRAALFLFPLLVGLAVGLLLGQGMPGWLTWLGVIVLLGTAAVFGKGLLSGRNLYNRVLDGGINVVEVARATPGERE